MIFGFWFYVRGSQRMNFGDDLNILYFSTVFRNSNLKLYNVTQRNPYKFIINNFNNLCKSPLLFFWALKNRYKLRTIYGIGSVLNEDRIVDSLVLGSGFISDVLVESNFVCCKDLKIYLLRGEKSLNIIKRMGLTATLKTGYLGDPGLLAADLIQLSKFERIKIPILVILHYTHISFKDFIRKRLGEDVFVVSAETTPKRMLTLISMSSIIISSSLHGMIFSHSLGKRVLKLDFFDAVLMGGDFKFIDYLSVFNDHDADKIFRYRVNYKTINLEQVCLYYTSVWHPSQVQVTAVKNNIYRAIDVFKSNYK